MKTLKLYEHEKHFSWWDIERAFKFRHLSKKKITKGRLTFDRTLVFFPYFHFIHGKLIIQRHRQSQMTAGDRIKMNTLSSSLKMCLEQLFNLLAEIGPSPPVWNLLIRAITRQNHRQEQWPQIKLTGLKKPWIKYVGQQHKLEHLWQLCYPMSASSWGQLIFPWSRRKLWQNQWY